MSVCDYIREDLILLDVPGTTKEEILQRACDALASAGVIGDAAACFTKIMEREELGSTGLSDGVAIPHARIDCDDIAIAVMRTANPIDFGALDGEPCRIFIVIVAPESAHEKYLTVMASAARVARSTQVRTALLEAKSPQEVLDIVHKACGD